MEKFVVIATVEETKEGAMFDKVFEGTFLECTKYVATNLHTLVDPEIIHKDCY